MLCLIAGSTMSGNICAILRGSKWAGGAWVLRLRRRRTRYQLSGAYAEIPEYAACAHPSLLVMNSSSRVQTPSSIAVRMTEPSRPSLR